MLWARHVMPRRRMMARRLLQIQSKNTGAPGQGPASIPPGHEILAFRRPPTMTAEQLIRYRDQLWKTVLRLQHDASLVGEPDFGDADNRYSEPQSNPTQHLDDLGAESYLHDLNATLLEN